MPVVAILDYGHYRTKRHYFNVSTVKIIQNKHINLLTKFVALITICTILLLSHLTTSPFSSCAASALVPPAGAAAVAAALAAGEAAEFPDATLSVFIGFAARSSFSLFLISA
jgi:hypothetical protein